MKEFLSPMSALLLSEDENAGKVAGARGHS